MQASEKINKVNEDKENKNELWSPKVAMDISFLGELMTLGLWYKGEISAMQVSPQP